MAGNQSERKREERRRKKKECEQRQRDKIKSDPVAYEEAKAKERERWQKRKAEQKVKTIKDMTPREQRKQRAIWRKEYRIKQQIKKRQESVIATANTSPTTDDEIFQANVENLNLDDTESPLQTSCSSPSISAYSSRQKIVGQRIKKRNYSLLKRVIEKQQQTIEKLQIKLNTLRVQKLRNTVRSLQRDERILPPRDRIARFKVTCAMRKKDVLKFLESDENSRIMPGKKDTITRNKIKKQRRLLSDTLRNLFKKFVSLGQPYMISYPTFCRLKPFWILEPNISKRETCLCSTHENFQFIIDKLHSSKLIHEKTCNDVARSVTCSTDNDECMIRECKFCRHKVPVISTFEDGPALFCTKSGLRSVSNELSQALRSKFTEQ